MEQSRIEGWIKAADGKIDIDKGILMCGDPDAYQNVVKCFLTIFDSKIDQIRSYLADIKPNLNNYTIEVHSLKSTCRTVGAEAIADAFFELELFGKSCNTDAILSHTGDILEQLRELRPALEIISGESERVLKKVDKATIITNFNSLIDASQEFDIDAVDRITEELKGYELPDNVKPLFDELLACVTNIDNEGIESTVSEILAVI